MVISVVGGVNVPKMDLARPPPAERQGSGQSTIGQEKGAMSIPQLLVHDRKDNVGVVVVEGLKAGTDMQCVVTADNSSFQLKSTEDVPIGHKIALKDLKVGDTAIKYGEDIGKIVADIPQGAHVHIHNLKTKRW
jgi:(2R)-sulfolactate sulfo-lyase subunit alpha